ncbi:MAG: retropepsin-like aspartic protease [bacterium]|nr:retropepsin-like aspartic protease [bacterium]
MTKDFSYFQKDGQFFPIIDVVLRNKGKELKTKALIDSGASFSVFRAEIADELGIVLEKGEKIYLSGVGGRILGYAHKVSVEVGKKNFTCKVVFSLEFNVSFNLLGRNNFFQPFVISFFEKQKRVVLKSN